MKKTLAALLLLLCLLPAGIHAQSTYTDVLYGAQTGAAIKAPTAVATTAAITLSGAQTIDGISVTQGARVLVKNQTDQTTNGIYVASLGAWQRAPDWQGQRDAAQGTIFVVYGGNTTAGLWQLTSANPVILNGSIFGSTPSNITVSQYNPSSGNIPTSICSTQGAVLYYNGSSYTCLVPGTNGQVLATQGASANPHWITTSGTGTVTSVATNNGLTGGTITTTGTIGLAPIGTSLVLSNPTGSSAVPIGTTVSALLDNAIASTQGDVLYRGASTWAALPPGTSGNFLKTNGAAANPSWAAAATGNYIDVQTFASTASWTKPVGTQTNSTVHLECWGGGAGGGGGSGGGGATNAGAGGGGSYKDRWILASLLASTETVTIGAAGTAGTSAGNGGNGGSSTFGSWLTAYGGSGGGGAVSGQLGGAAGGNFATATAATRTNDTSGNEGTGGNITGPVNPTNGYFIGGGGGCGTAQSCTGVGGKSVWGGGGGGCGSSGGTSSFGGSGGATNTAGSAPAGGGGCGSTFTDGGAGAKGQCIATTFF